MALVLCRRCRLLLVAEGDTSMLPPSPTPPLFLRLLRLTRRGIKPTRTPGHRDEAVRTTKFVRQLDRLPDTPFAPYLMPGGLWAQAGSFAGRAAAAAAIGGLFCLAVAERKRRWREGDEQTPRGAGLEPFNYGYANVDADLSEQFRTAAPVIAFFVPAFIIGNLLRSPRLAQSALSTACRHLFDRPGRSALLTSPWVSSLWAMKPGEFLGSGVILTLLSVAHVGLSPEEKVLAFFTGVLASSAGRSVYKSLAMRGAGTPSFWYGPLGGITTLVVLAILSIRQQAIRVQLAGDGGDAVAENMPRTIKRGLLSLEPNFATTVLGAWTTIEILMLVLWRRLPALGRCSPELQRITSLTGMATGWTLWACLDWQSSKATAEVAAATTAKPAEVPAAAAAVR